jgi:hypothetical protein
MANFSRLPDNTPTPHQATAHRVFGRDLDSWKALLNDPFFVGRNFTLISLEKKKGARALFFHFGEPLQLHCSPAGG